MSFTPHTENNFREKPPRFLPLLLGMGAGVFLLSVALAYTSIDWHEAKNRYALWRAGARPLLWEKYRGFQSDRCGGKAPSECPCVWFVHGLGDSVSTWRKVFLDPNAFGAAPVRLLALDLPGHGGSLSRRDTAEYRASAVAREIDAGIAGTAACTRNTLVGNSLGGWISALAALENPEHYERLFLISPAGVKQAEEETKNLFTDGSVESLKEFQRRAYFRPRELPESVWRKVAEKMGRGGILKFSNAQVDADRLDVRLPKLSVPTTLIRGDADRILSQKVADVFIAKVPGLKFIPLKDCGHLPQKECYSDLIKILAAGIGTR